MRTIGLPSFSAISCETRTSEAAPSLTGQQSNMCNGSAIGGLFTTASGAVRIPSIVTVWWMWAYGLFIALL